MELEGLIYWCGLISNLNALLLVQGGKDGKESMPAGMSSVDEADAIKQKEKRKREREV